MVLTALLMALVCIATSMIMGLYWAWAATILWGWFIVPIFHAPVLTVLQMYGVVLVLTALRPHLPPSKTDWESAWIVGVIGPLIVLGVGYLIKVWGM